MAGRITAVADAYDVITSRRSYKKPLEPSAARQELIRCARSQFAPDVVRAFLNVSLVNVADQEPPAPVELAFEVTASTIGVTDDAESTSSNPAGSTPAASPD